MATLMATSVHHRRIEEGIAPPARGIQARPQPDWRGMVMGYGLMQAARQAARSRLLTRREADRVLADLGAAA